jgi:acyl carrier protein
MSQAIRLERIRSFVEQALSARDRCALSSDDESLILSGRLDSLAVTRLVVFLEQELGVDFSAEPFDVELLDSVTQIAALAARHARVERT